MAGVHTHRAFLLCNYLLLGRPAVVPWWRLATGAGRRPAVGDSAWVQWRWQASPAATRQLLSLVAPSPQLSRSAVHPAAGSRHLGRGQVELICQI
uniref:Secreted protein n=1 Tax=Oryza barthii TaxID=65489 RepID=A0A0D3EQH5_9ORYZ